MRERGIPAHKARSYLPGLVMTSSCDSAKALPSSTGPLLVLTEFAPHGNLRDFLRARRSDAAKPADLVRPNLSVRDFLTFSYQVARGMEYLASKSVSRRRLIAADLIASRACAPRHNADL